MPADWLELVRIRTRMERIRLNSLILKHRDYLVRIGWLVYALALGYAFGS